MATPLGVSSVKPPLVSGYGSLRPVADKMLVENVDGMVCVVANRVELRSR